MQSVSRVRKVYCDIYVAARVDSMFINCLVDTGAAYSLSSHDIIPPNVIISPTSVQLCGVTGAPLHILGAATLPRGGSGTKCRTSRRLSVVLDIFH